jgi:hypothetical protein
MSLAPVNEMRSLPLLLCLAPVLGLGQSSDVKLYRNNILNIQFEHPKAWKVETNRRNESRILIPIEGTQETALLEILPVTFESEKDIWLTAQKTVVANARYELVRQWEEEILRVPMLLTRYTFPNSRGVQVVTSALLYSDWPRKFFWRLSAGTFEYEKAEFAWRQVLQTLRTVDGSEFKVLDPNAPREKNRKVVPVEAVTTKTVMIDDGTGSRRKGGVETGEQLTEARAAGRDVVVRGPKGWAVLTGEGGFTLRHPELEGPLRMKVESSLDADPAGRALFLASSRSLGLYASVAERKEQLPKPNPAGAKTAWVFRTGKSAQGFLSTWEATVEKGDFYLVLSYETTSTREVERARKLLDQFLRLASVDPKP